MYLETRSKFYDTDLETAVIKTKQKTCPKWNHKLQLKWLSTALKEQQMLTRSGITNHQQIPLVLHVQHQYGVVSYLEALLSRNAKY